MYCSTCGSRVAEGRASCQSCGAVVARAGGMAALPAYSPLPAAPAASPYAEAVSVCPRCGYRGASASYFSRGAPVAWLVGLTIITAGALGVGGVVYYLLRRNHRCCPRCGYGWGENGSRALMLSSGQGTAVQAGASGGDDDGLALGGSGRSGLSVALFIFAAVLLVAGIADFAMPAIIMGLMAGGGGYLLQRGAKEDRERRRDAVLQSLQLPVLKLAGKKGGRLTVTDVATEMGWPMARAEKVLNSLEDGLRVMSDITDDGVIVYDFLEIRAGQLGGGGGTAGALQA